MEKSSITIFCEQVQELAQSEVIAIRGESLEYAPAIVQ